MQVRYQAALHPEKDKKLGVNHSQFYNNDFRSQAI